MLNNATDSPARKNFSSPCFDNVKKAAVTNLDTTKNFKIYASTKKAEPPYPP